MIQRHEVYSSFVRAIEYDPATRHATVHLAGGSYHAHDVPAEDVDAMVSARRVGTHFNKVFKAKHGGKLKRL